MKGEGNAPEAPVTKPEISEALRQRIAEISNENAKYRVSVPNRKSVRRSVDRRSNISGAKKAGSAESENDGSNGVPLVSPSAAVPARRPSRRPVLPPAVAGKLLIQKPPNVNIPPLPRKVSADKSPALGLIETRKPEPETSSEKSSYTPPSSNSAGQTNDQKDTTDDDGETLTNLLKVNSLSHKKLSDLASNSKPLSPMEEVQRELMVTAEMADDDTIPREAVKEFQDKKAQHEQAKARLMGKIAQVSSEFSITQKVQPTSPQKYRGPPSELLMNDFSAPNSPKTPTSVAKGFSMHSTASAQTSIDVDLLQKKITLLETTLSSTEERFIDSKKRYEQEIKELKEAREKSGTSNGDEELLEEVERLKNELKESESKHSDQIASMEQKYAELEEKLKESEQEAEEHVNELQETIESLKDQLQEANDNSRVQELEKELATLQESTVPSDHHEHVKKSLEDEVEQLKEDLLEKEEKIQAFKDTENELASLKEENARLEQNLKNANTEIQDLKALVEELQSENTRMEEQVAESESNKETILDLEVQVKQLEDDKEDMLKDLEEKDIKLKALNADLEDLKESFELSKEESNRNIDDLVQIYEAVQKENKELRDRLHTVSSTAKDRSPELSPEHAANMEALLKEKEELESAAKYWEQSALELEQTLDALEAEKDGLLREMENNSTGGGSEKVRYLSNDDEIMEFIETMSRKTEVLKAEAENLREENERLKAGGLKSASSSSSLLDDSQLKNLQNQYELLKKEYEVMALDLKESREEIQELSKELQSRMEEVKNLVKQLDEEKAKTLGISTTGEPATLLKIRKDFKKAIEEARKESYDALQKEISLRHEAEKAIRALKKEKEMALLSQTD
jgi:DNA repair exonuclease SbcCD ATPase subunit